MSCVVAIRRYHIFYYTITGEDLSMEYYGVTTQKFSWAIISRIIVVWFQGDTLESEEERVSKGIVRLGITSMGKGEGKYIGSSESPGS